MSRQARPDLPAASASALIASCLCPRRSRTKPAGHAAGGCVALCLSGGAYLPAHLFSVHAQAVPFDFSKAYVVDENQRSMGFMPIGLDVESTDLFWGMSRPTEPIRFRQHLGSAVADLMMGGDPALLIISDTVVATLLDIGATGWTTYPVECRTRRGELVPSRFGWSVTGRCGAPQWQLSKRFQRQLVQGAPPAPYLKGLQFAEDSWDGSDVFSPVGTTFVVVTERVYRAMRAAKVRNFGYRRLSDFVMLDHERMLAESDSPPWLH